MKFPKKTIWALAWLWGLWYLVNEYPSEVWQTIWTIVWTVDGIIETWAEAVNNISQPILGSAAPFAFPMIAWWALGKKLSDAMWIEWKWKKRATTVLWTWIWAWLWVAASTSVLAPYLTVAWAGYSAYKGAKLVKWGWKKLIWWVKGFYNWVKTA